MTPASYTSNVVSQSTDCPSVFFRLLLLTTKYPFANMRLVLSHIKLYTLKMHFDNPMHLQTAFRENVLW